MKKPAFGSSGDGSRKKKILKSAIILLGILAVAACLKVSMDKDSGIQFTQLADDAVPQKITSQIIPEYRDMERALACIVDDKVYVLATRGKKPTTGYDIEIDGMKLKDEKGKKTLVVNVLFTDPQAGASLTQEATYPYVIAETDIAKLPENIEMKIRYKD